ncbi:hypothetical protein T4D_2249 [Trichinella pseudospiralis]|uniref:Uncharacterized protein n=1 Tax=Trichinella pseudospiralis TaxID=6337 RepID=A0A0V1FCW7_TRIPS|nr:hypothetical protein T4D_2249 [Trichinella pseudospiralis]
MKKRKQTDKPDQARPGQARPGVLAAICGSLQRLHHHIMSFCYHFCGPISLFIHRGPFIDRLQSREFLQALSSLDNHCCSESSTAVRVGLPPSSYHEFLAGYFLTDSRVENSYKPCQVWIITAVQSPPQQSGSDCFHHLLTNFLHTDSRVENFYKPCQVWIITAVQSPPQQSEPDCLHHLLTNFLHTDSRVENFYKPCQVWIITAVQSPPQQSGSDCLHHLITNFLQTDSRVENSYKPCQVWIITAVQSPPQESSKMAMLSAGTDGL